MIVGVENAIQAIIEKVEGIEAIGKLIWLRAGKEIYRIPFISGKYGKGPCPRGEFKAYQVLKNDKDAYKQFGFGWEVPIEPQFKTDRTGLEIHPDGNVPGTLGCIGCEFPNLAENVKLYNLFRDFFDHNNILKVIVK